MKKTLFISLIVLFNSCSSNSDNNEQTDERTQAKITLKYSNGSLAQNQVIFLHVFPENSNGNYQYNSDTEYGDAQTNELGVAVFDDLASYPTAFESGNIQVFGFDAYGENNANKKLEVTFNKKDVKEFEMILN